MKAFYTVRPGDTLYNIAVKFNILLNGQPRPDLIINANPWLTSDIVPGMMLAIPFPPPGGPGRIAAVLYDGLQFHLGIYDANTGYLDTIEVIGLDQTTNIFWSPDQRLVAAVGSSGIISIVDTVTKKISRIDWSIPPTFADWAPDSRRIAYSNGSVIRIYDVLNHTFRTINRNGALYVQWFPNGLELLYEAKDQAGLSQLYRYGIESGNEIQITNNTNGLHNEVRLSPNGRYVLYTTPGVSISEIYTIELATGNMYKIPGGPEAKNYYPTWSPDSTRIAYSSTQFINGRYYSLIRSSGVRGEGDSTLAVSTCYSTPMTWSPDSTRIAYLSGCQEEYMPAEIWSIDIRKPVLVNVLRGFIFYNLDWSPAR